MLEQLEASYTWHNMGNEAEQDIKIGKQKD
jgi:hypothetical protein